MLPHIQPNESSEVKDPMPSKTDSRDSKDLLVNNLIYRQPKELSLAKSRTNVKQFFQRSDYIAAQGKTAICEWNTGSSYIDTFNSHLVFNLSVTVDSSGVSDTVTFGRGSAMNLINNITIRTKSGSEVERLEDANLWSYTDVQYVMPRNYKRTVGSLFGMDQQYIGLSSEQPKFVFKLAIPLTRLCPFFRPLKGQLMPPQLASGLHIQVVFENQFKPFVLGSGLNPVISYDVTDIHFLLDSVELSDEAQKAINLQSADNGLEWVTPRIYRSPQQIKAGVTQVTTQIRKAVTQATQAYAVIQPLTITDSKVDKFASIPTSNRVKFQFNIGSIYFPSQRAEDRYASYPIASYIEAMKSYDKSKHPYAGCDVTLADFRTTSGIYAMTASRDDSLLLSGLNISNSRVLQFRYEGDDNTGADKIMTVFLEYMQVCKLYMNNSVVSI